MALFGLREDKTPAEMQEELLRQARKGYDARRKAFCDAGDTLEMVCQQGQIGCPCPTCGCASMSTPLYCFPRSIHTI